jgi:hypothetical protein
MSSLLTRYVLLPILLIAGSGTLQAQPGVTKGLLNVQGYPAGFQPSADRSVLAFFNMAPNGDPSFVIFNLRDFSTRTVPALSREARIDPESGAQYFTEAVRSYNGDSTKSNIRLHYSKDGTAVAERVYEDRWLPLEFALRGALIVANSGGRGSGEAFSARNLRIVDPETGTDVKPLYPGPLLTMADVNSGAWAQKFSFIVQPSTGALLRVNRQSGQAVLFQQGAPVQTYKTGCEVYRLDDTLLVADRPYAAGAGRITAYGFRSGQKLIDTQFNSKLFAAAWTYSKGRLWAIHEGSGGITEYALTGAQPEALALHKLEMELVPYFASTAAHQSLVVSPEANRVMLLPNWNNNLAMPCNEAFIWELSSGKLLHVITNFFNYRRANAVAAANLEKALAAQHAGLATKDADSSPSKTNLPSGEEKPERP